MIIVPTKEQIDCASEMTQALLAIEAEVVYELVDDTGNKSFVNSPVKVAIHRNGKFQIITEKIYKSLEKNFMEHNKGEKHE